MKINEVSAAGKILGMGRDNYGHASITLLIDKGRNKEGERISAFPKFVMPQGVPLELRIQDFVEVKGGVHGYEYFNEPLQRYSHIQYLVADEVKKAGSVLEERFGLEGRSHIRSHCDIYLSGMIKRVSDTKQKDWGRLLLETRGTKTEARSQMVTLSYYKSRFLPDFSQWKSGDTVCLYASLRTRRVEFNEGLKTLESLYVEDISYADKEETDEQFVTNGPEDGVTVF